MKKGENNFNYSIISRAAASALELNTVEVPKQLVANTILPELHRNQETSSLRTMIPGAAVAVRLNEEQMAKLKSELDIVDTNILVMNEMITHQQSSKITDEDVTFLKELYKTTSEMQKRITQLIGNISNENIIGELLRINDDLNNAFVRYDR